MEVITGWVLGLSGSQISFLAGLGLYCVSSSAFSFSPLAWAVTMAHNDASLRRTFSGIDIQVVTFLSFYSPPLMSPNPIPPQHREIAILLPV